MIWNKNNYGFDVRTKWIQMKWKTNEMKNKQKNKKRNKTYLNFAIEHRLWKTVDNRWSKKKNQSIQKKLGQIEKNFTNRKKNWTKNFKSGMNYRNIRMWMKQFCFFWSFLNPVIPHFFRNFFFCFRFNSYDFVFLFVASNEIIFFSLLSSTTSSEGVNKQARKKS